MRTVFLFLLALFVMSIEPTFSRDIQPNETVWVPLLYATDRVFDPHEKGISFKDDQMDAPSLNFGVKTLGISLPKNCNLDTQVAKQLGWRVDGAKGNTIVDGPIENSTLTREDFLSRVAEAQQKSPKHEILVFVHGCCTKHEDAVSGGTAAALWYGLPTVLYDWQSPPWNWKAMFTSKADYLKNEDRNASSEGRLNDLLDEMETRCSSNRISILAHSMGNRLVDSYVQSRQYRYGRNRDHEKLQQIDLSNADLTVGKFVSDSPSFTWAARRTRIFVDDRDPALFASRKIHKAYRTGAPGPERGKLINTDRVDVVDHQAITGNSHDLPFWLTSDLFKSGRVGGGRKCALKQLGPHLYSVESSAK